MPTKFVQNTAARMGTSVEHAEKVWHDAKQSVKKGKRQGSWYWGKVVNTFKRMMGIKEHITFAEFAELLESDQGQYKNDAAERAMIHRIVQLANQNRLMRGGKTEANIEKAYDFLESDWGGRLWDKHYELFTSMNPDFEGPFDKRRYGTFGREAVEWYRAWLNGRKLPRDAKVPEPMHEAKGDSPSVPQGTRNLLNTLGSDKVIMLTKGYYLEFNDVRPLKATWNFRRLMRDMTEQDHMYMVVARRGGADGKYIFQAWGDPIESLKWDQRSKIGTLEEVKPFDKQSMKEFGIGILAYAGLLKEEKEQ